MRTSFVQVLESWLLNLRRRLLLDQLIDLFEFLFVLSHLLHVLLPFHFGGGLLFFPLFFHLHFSFLTLLLEVLLGLLLLLLDFVLDPLFRLLFVQVQRVRALFLQVLLLLLLGIFQGTQNTSDVSLPDITLRRLDGILCPSGLWHVEKLSIFIIDNLLVLCRQN